MPTEYIHFLERRKFIVEMLNGGETMRVTELANRFDVGDSSIRNDLKFLRKIGLDVGTKNGFAVFKTAPAERETIIRELEFPPEYKESAVSILSYFSRIVEQKYPNIETSVSIRQSGNRVTLKVETDRGEIETIERTLDEYGAVVVGTIAPSDMFSDPTAIVELQNRLEITKLELRLRAQSHLTHTSYQEDRISSLERQLSEVRALVGTQLATVTSLSGTIEKLVDADRVSPAVARAVQTLTELLRSDRPENRENEIREAFEVIRREDGSLYEKLTGSLTSIGNSVVANLSTPWVVAFLNSLPK